jgi:hypothetical protein
VGLKLFFKLQLVVTSILSVIVTILLCAHIWLRTTVGQFESEVNFMTKSGLVRKLRHTKTDF